MVAGRAAVLGGAADSLGAGRLPLHLLLLSRRLLQGVLGGSAWLYRGRAAQVVLGRAVVSARHAEHSPLLPLSRPAVHRDPHLRCDQVVPVHRRVRRRGRQPGNHDQHHPAGQLHLQLPLAAASRRRTQGRSVGQRVTLRLLRGVLLAEPAAPGVRLAEPVLRGLRRHLRPPLLDGDLDRLPPAVITFESFEYDVLVIGAGGAGLRAAIEASAAGVKVGLICKSLLGKAHTVMAEGGVAAALANVDDRDSWKVHFADTMRGGQYVNNWRMAELHAKEAPDRVRELEAWG